MINHCQSYIKVTDRTNDEIDKLITKGKSITIQSNKANNNKNIINNILVDNLLFKFDTYSKSGASSDSLTQSPSSPNSPKFSKISTNINKNNKINPIKSFDFHVNSINKHKKNKKQDVNIEIINYKDKTFNNQDYNSYIYLGDNNKRLSSSTLQSNSISQEIHNKITDEINNLPGINLIDLPNYDDANDTSRRSSDVFDNIIVKRGSLHEIIPSINAISRQRLNSKASLDDILQTKVLQTKSSNNTVASYDNLSDLSINEPLDSLDLLDKPSEDPYINITKKYISSNDSIQSYQSTIYSNISSYQSINSTTTNKSSPWRAQGTLGRVLPKDTSDRLVAWNNRKLLLYYTPIDNTKTLTKIKLQNNIKNILENYSKKSKYLSSLNDYKI